MNRKPNDDLANNLPALANQTPISSTGSTLGPTKNSQPTGNGNSGIPTSSSALMNGNGDILYRHSPIFSPSASHVASNHSPTASTHNQSTGGSYYQSVGGSNSLSITNVSSSYNSDEISVDAAINFSSLEEEQQHFNELNLKFLQLQKQIHALTETQANQDERYKRSRQENDELLNRVHCLEDQLRELEINSQTRAQEDEKRFKETMARKMKIKSDECEQHLQANYLLQQDLISLQKDLRNSDSLIKALRSEKDALESELHEKNSELVSLDEELHKLRLLVKNLKDEESVKSNIISILNEELEDTHNRSQASALESSLTGGRKRNDHHHPLTSSPKQANANRLSSSSEFGDFPSPSDTNSKQHHRTLIEFDLLESDLSKLRNENKRLKETNEELQAQLLNAQLEKGRSLVQESGESFSLADELGDVDVPELKVKLKEQYEVNAELKRYIDDMLLRIVANNPEILDRTAKPSGDSDGRAEIKTNDS